MTDRTLADIIVHPDTGIPHHKVGVCYKCDQTAIRSGLCADCEADFRAFMAADDGDEMEIGR